MIYKQAFLILFLQICKRFPLTLLICTVMFAVQNEFLPISKMLFGLGERVFAVLLLWQLVFAFLFEKKIVNQVLMQRFKTPYMRDVVKLFANILTVSILSFFMIVCVDVFSQTQWLALSLIFLLFVLPFVGQKSEQNQLREYQLVLVSHTFVSLIATLTLVGGSFAINLMIEYLFGLHWNLAIWYSFCGWVVFPLLLLMGIPFIEEHDQKQEIKLNSFLPCQFENLKIAQMFIEYLLVPLTSIYMLILYLYIISIALKWELPRGKIVMYLSIAGFAAANIYILLNTTRMTLNAYTNTFKKYLGYALIPLLGLMLVALGRRIHDYGFTQARYMLCVVLIALTIFAALLIVLQNKDVTKPWFLSMSALCLFAAVSPWNSVQVSLSSQFAKITPLLTAHNMKVSEAPISLLSSLTQVDHKRYAQVFEYIGQFRKSEQVKRLLDYLDRDARDRLLKVKDPYYWKRDFAKELCLALFKVDISSEVYNRAPVLSQYNPPIDVLYHGSVNQDIKLIEPRAKTIRNESEGAVVFATPSMRLASCHLFQWDDSWVHQSVTRRIAQDGGDKVVMVIADKERFQHEDRGGAIYIVPVKTFGYVQNVGLGDYEWVSKQAVPPLYQMNFKSALKAMETFGVEVYFVSKKEFEHYLSLNDNEEENFLNKIKR